MGEGCRSNCTSLKGRPATVSKPTPLLDAVPEGSIFLADKAYDSDAIRETVEARGAFANIPAKSNRKKSFTFSAVPVPLPQSDRALLRKNQTC